LNFDKFIAKLPQTAVLSNESTLRHRWAKIKQNEEVNAQKKDKNLSFFHHFVVNINN